MARALPHDPDAERRILGTIMVYPERVEQLYAHLGEDDFYIPLHRWVFVAMTRIVERGELIDLSALDLQLKVSGHTVQLDKLGEIYSGWVAYDLAPHVTRVRELGEARRLLVKMNEVASDLAALNESPSTWIEGARNMIEERAEDRRESRAKTADQLMTEELKSWKAKKEGASMGMAYGLGTLDHRLLGMVPPEYVIICARPSIGKSALGLQFARSLARSTWRERDVHVRYDLFESTSARLTERMLSQESRIDYSSIRRGNLNEGNRENLGPAIMRIRALRLTVEDENCDEQSLYAKWRSWRNDIGKDNAAVIVLDYLQLVHPSNPKLPREAQVTMASRAAMQASKRLDCAMIVLCQLNRDVEKRGTKARPQLSDLRESGSIEQDATTVLAIHRPGAIADTDEERKKAQAADKGPKDDPRYTELITLKARDGELGTDTLSFNGRILTFEETTLRPEPDAPPPSAPPRGQLSFNPKNQPD